MNQLSGRQYHKLKASFMNLMKFKNLLKKQKPEDNLSTSTMNN